MNDFQDSPAAQIERLRAALEPFARVASAYGKRRGDREVLLSTMLGDITVGDLRAALAALD